MAKEGKVETFLTHEKLTTIRVWNVACDIASFAAVTFGLISPDKFSLSLYDSSTRSATSQRGKTPRNSLRNKRSSSLSPYSP